jgi:hypothetical protein
MRNWIAHAYQEIDKVNNIISSNRHRKPRRFFCWFARHGRKRTGAFAGVGEGCAGALALAEGPRRLLRKKTPVSSFAVRSGGWRCGSVTNHISL